MYMYVWLDVNDKFFPKRQKVKAFNLRVFYSLLEPWQVFWSGCHGAGPGTQRVIGQADRHSAGEVVSGGKGLWERNKWEGWKVEGRKSGRDEKVGGMKGGEKGVNVKYNKSWNFHGG